ncbi:hypothetical protein [Rubrivirga sp.]|uniref:hypothetical protein n=1 Tax=Rubrivirga sp. TaxID=1885344 RepID=UPI003C71B879
MSALSIALFDVVADLEAAEYRVRSGLRTTRVAFRDLCVEPHFGAAVALHRSLSALVEGADVVDETGPVTGVDWDTGRLTRQRGDAPLALDLARWALPLLSDVLEEGKAVYEFVSDHVELSTVGLVPSYQDEGFLLIEDGDRLRALRYRVSPLTGPSGSYRALRTSALDVALDPRAVASEWKAALAQAVPELPMPATFRLAADVDLPVDETLVPLAKRKLLGLVGGWGEA